MLRQNALTIDHSVWRDVVSDFGNSGTRFNRPAGGMQSANGGELSRALAS